MTPTIREHPSGCWPTPLQADLLKASLLDGDAARHAWSRWEERAGFPRIDEGSIRLLPLVFRNAQRLGLSSPLVEELQGIHRRSWYKNQVLFQEVAQVLEELHQAGIETLLLKGVPLALSVYPDEGARPMGDVDVLVKPTDVRPAVDVLRRTGWTPVPEPQVWPAEPRNAWTFVDRSARELDLHWRVFRVGSADDEDLWAASERLEVRGVHTRALCRTDQLLHVIAHGLAWNPMPSVRWIADAVLTIRAGAIDWTRLCDLASQRGLVPTTALALSYLAKEFGSSVPDDVLQRLHAYRLSRPEKLALWAQTEPGVVAGALRVWFDYVEYERGRRIRPGPVAFWRYLRGFWQVPQDRWLAGVLAERVQHRRSHDSAAR